MNIDLIRKFDKFIGIPLCAIFSLIHQLTPRRYTLKSEKSNRILIIKLTEMGSTVLAYPAFQKLKHSSPHIELHFLTLEENSSILEALKVTTPPCIHSLPSTSAIQFILKLINSISLLKKLQFDAVIDFDFFSRLSAIISYMVCKKKRVGFHRYTCEGLYRGNFLTHPVIYSPHIHTSEAFFALVEAALDDASMKPLLRKKIPQIKDFSLPEYKPPHEKTKNILEKLSKYNITPHNEKIIIINPNASNLFPLRKWPLKCFIETIQQLLEYKQIKIVITGSPSEKPEAQYIKNKINSPACIELAGETDFEELLALYSLSTLLITNDSGPAHFASIVHLPTIVLFGPETPRLYSPLGKDVYCLYSNFPCSPCVSVYNAKKSPCIRSLCMEAITVDEVMQCVNKVLSL